MCSGPRRSVGHTARLPIPLVTIKTTRDTQFLVNRATGLLNKLTFERFDAISEQIASVGVDRYGWLCVCVCVNIRDGLLLIFAVWKFVSLWPGVFYQ